MEQYIKWFVAIVIAGTLADCVHTTPIGRVHTSVGAGRTQDQVRTTIPRAGIQRQWVMSEAGSGVIKARQQTRDRIVEVHITYTAISYNIKYDNNLSLRASGEKVHRNYNR